jgi:hypothetical protein
VGGFVKVGTAVGMQVGTAVGKLDTTEEAAGMRQRMNDEEEATTTHA